MGLPTVPHGFPSVTAIKGVLIGVGKEIVNVGDL